MDWRIHLVFSLSTSSGVLYFSFFWLVGEIVANEFAVDPSSDNPSSHFTLDHLNTCATQKKKEECNMFGSLQWPWKSGGSVAEAHTAL